MQTNNAETAEQTAALESVVPELERLGNLLADGNQAQAAALERFAVEPDLKRLRDLIEEQRTEFDALHFLKLSSDEEFHSNFLAWLLDPKQNHGLGDYFLRSFLLQTGAQAGTNNIDWSGTSVHREWVNEVDGQWGYLDILVLNQAEEFFCAIENKIWSLEHSEQLTRYRKALEERYPQWRKHHVFLSPRGTLPYREEEQKYWTASDYKIVLQLVEQTISNTANPVREDVRAFLQQYAITLRRNIMPDANTNIAELARKIYLEHREAIELIYRNKPDYRDEMKRILKESISTHTDWKLCADDLGFVYFQPLGFTEYQGMQPGESHARYSLVGCEFQCPQEGNARFCVEIAPETETNKRVRDRIVNTINENPRVFNSAGQLATGWMTVHWGDYILDDGDLSKWDAPAVRAKIEAWVKNFAENEFPAMNDVIVNCLRECEAEQNGGQ